MTQVLLLSTLAAFLNSLALLNKMSSLASPQKPVHPRPSSPEAPAEPAENESGLLPPQHWAQLNEVSEMDINFCIEKRN